jgi:predicted aspartyl protease/tetratricopeptide (TPR) repeat protein
MRFIARIGANGLLPLMFLGLNPPAHAACKMSKMAELPVIMVGPHPLTDAKINDKPVRFIVDSGAVYSMISSASATELGLKIKDAPYGMRIVGVGGVTKAMVASVDVFTLAGIPVRNMQFLVNNSLGSLGGESVGLLGQNVFGVSDVEYDFANGKIRFIKSDDCPHAMLAYWVPAGQSYSVVDIDPISLYHTHITGSAYLNGAKIQVTFDTGTTYSVLGLRAAERAGIDRKSPGVLDAGYVTGIGAGGARSYVATFSSFKVGDEEIRNAKLRFAGIPTVATDMLLGADFFLSHRVYLAAAQHKLYFTYNGGPVFNLKPTTIAAPAGEAPESAESKDSLTPSETADEHVADTKNAAEKQDAAEFGRRGAASASRQDYEHALGDLTRACELAPDNPEYFFQRAVVYRRTAKPALANKDLDRALELKPDYILALLERAQMRTQAKNFQGARADLDAVDQYASKQSDIRFDLALGYLWADLPGQAVAQFDTWTAAHKQDSKWRGALSSRCWARALQNENLDEALSDCDRALHAVYEKTPGYSDVLRYHGFVRYRMGRYDKAISDYDDALKLDPKSAATLYCRGLAKIKLKRTEDGQADIAQALKIQPTVADQFNRLGITP